MDSKRDASVDIAKGIGILFVIGGHCGFDIPDFPTYSFHMPLFYFIGGFFLTPRRSFAEVIIHRSKTLLFPYVKYNLFFGIVSFLLSFIGITWAHATFYSAINAKNLFIEPFITGHQFMISCPLWFVPSMFLVTILFQPLAKILQNIYQSKLKIFFLLIFMLSVYYIATNSCTLKQNITIAVLSRTVIGLVFCILGNLYYNKKNIIPNGALLIISISTYALLSMKYGLFIYSSFLNEYPYGTGRNISFFVSLSGLLVYISLSVLLARSQNSTLNNLFKFFGQNSFHVMAIHLSFFLILNIFITFLSPQFRIADIDSVYFLYPNIRWLYFLFSTICCYLTITSFQKFRKKINFIQLR